MTTESVGIIIFSTVTAIGLTILAVVGYLHSIGEPAGRQAQDTLHLSMTTIEKNQTWPVIREAAANPCMVNDCEDV